MVPFIQPDPPRHRSPATYATQRLDVALRAAAVVELSEARAVPHQVGVAGTTWPAQRGLLQSHLQAEEEEGRHPGHNKRLLDQAGDTYIMHACMMDVGGMQCGSHVSRGGNRIEVPVCLQAVPQAVVVMADREAQLLALHNAPFGWQEVNTLHPVVAPLEPYRTTIPQYLP